MIEGYGVKPPVYIEVGYYPMSNLGYSSQAAGSVSGDPSPVEDNPSSDVVIEGHGYPAP